MTPGIDDDFDKAFGPQSTENVTPSPVDQQQPSQEYELPHSPMGKASFWLSMGYIFAWIIGLTIREGGGIFILGLIALVCNIVGLILGIIALSQRGYRRGYAVAGTIINSFFLLALIFVIFYIISNL